MDGSPRPGFAQFYQRGASERQLWVDEHHSLPSPIADNAFDAAALTAADGSVLAIVSALIAPLASSPRSAKAFMALTRTSSMGSVLTALASVETESLPATLANDFTAAMRTKGSSSERNAIDKASIAFLPPS